MVDKNIEEKRKEKNLIYLVKQKVSDLRTGAITIILFIALAYIGSLFAKNIIRKIMSVDVVVIVSSIVFGVAGVIILCVAYVVVRWIGAAINRYFKEKGF